jgi:hypothetical protein
VSCHSRVGHTAAVGDVLAQAERFSSVKLTSGSDPGSNPGALETSGGEPSARLGLRALRPRPRSASGSGRTCLPRESFRYRGRRGSRLRGGVGCSDRSAIGMSFAAVVVKPSRANGAEIVPTPMAGQADHACDGRCRAPENPSQCPVGPARIRACESTHACLSLRRTSGQSIAIGSSPCSH